MHFLILQVMLSNFDEYYFNSLYYKPAYAAEKMPFRGTPHIGMFQDSYLIHCEGTSVYIKYFPHYQNIEFYSVDTENKAFFVENIGDITLYVRFIGGLICLGPGERKEVCEANAEKEEPLLPKLNQRNNPIQCKKYRIVIL